MGGRYYTPFTTLEMLYTGHRRVCPFPSSVKCVLDIIYRHFFPSGTRNTVQNNNTIYNLKIHFFTAQMKNSFLSLKLLFRLNIFLEEVWLELNPGNSLLQSLKILILDSLAQDQGVFAG